jgi:hypothetical protein
MHAAVAEAGPHRRQTTPRPGHYLF